MARLERILYEYITQVWDNQNFDVIGDFIGQDLEATGLVPGETVAAEDVEDVVKMFNAIMTDRKTSIVKSVEEEDWLSAMVVTSGTSAYSQIDISVRFQLMARFKDDKIVEYYIHCDFMSFFEEMGLLPSGSMGFCLSGQRLQPPA